MTDFDYAADTLLVDQALRLGHAAKLVK